MKKLKQRRNKILNINKLNKKIKEKFPNEEFKVISYKGMREPFQIKCLSCNTVYDFQAAQNFFLRKCGCKKCVDTPEWARQKENFKIWLMSHPEFELIDDLDKIHNSQSHIRCRCTICGRIQENKKVYNYYDGKQCFCQTKSTKKPMDQLHKDFQDICIFLEPYQNTDAPILLQSKFCGHSFKAPPKDILRNKYYCPICKSSKGEKRILEWLELKGISYERQKKIIINNKLVKIDFYLPDKNLYIEYNGEQHYRPVEHFGGEITFQHQQERDCMVREYIQQIGSKLIEISYKEFDQVEQILLREVL